VEAKAKLLEAAAAALAEHFDAVQILATSQEEGTTHSFYRGQGNWYARQGLAHEFINSDIAQDAAVQIAEQIKKAE
jgi:hypothetical protein